MLVSNSWDEHIDQAFGLDRLWSILEDVNLMRKDKTIYPEKKDVFTAFKLTDFEQVKVVIIGQDPYFNPGQAHGLAFSVNKGIRPPASLKNIFKELNSDLGLGVPLDGNLSPWARQGVFLLNSTLTVEEKKPNSHSNIGWQDFTDSIIHYLSDKKENLVFILWGKFAKKKASLIDSNKHLILQSSHPSPLSASRSFFNSKVFSKTNNYLREKNIKEIDWSL